MYPKISLFIRKNNEEIECFGFEVERDIRGGSIDFSEMFSHDFSKGKINLFRADDKFILSIPEKDLDFEVDVNNGEMENVLNIIDNFDLKAYFFENGFLVCRGRHNRPQDRET